jgi:hypothetical protein
VPSRSDSEVPSRSDSEVPSRSDSEVPSRSDGEVPSLSDREVRVGQAAEPKGVMPWLRSSTQSSYAEPSDGSSSEHSLAMRKPSISSPV